MLIGCGSHEAWVQPDFRLMSPSLPGIALNLGRLGTIPPTTPSLLVLVRASFLSPRLKIPKIPPLQIFVSSAQTFETHRDLNRSTMQSAHALQTS